MITARWVFALFFSIGALPVQGQNMVADLHQSGLQAYREGRYGQAESLFRSALDAARDDKAKATIHADLGTLFLDEEKTAEAEQSFTNSLALYRRTGENLGVAIVLRHLGALYSVQGRHGEAIDFLKRALKTVRGDRNAEPSLTAAILNSLGVAYVRSNRLADAAEALEEALKTVGPASDRPEPADILSNLGAIAYRQREFGKAEELFREAVTRTVSRLGPNHPALTFTLTAMGRMYVDMGRMEDAEALFLRCLQILEQNDGDFLVRIAVTLHALGDTYLKAGKKEQGALALQRASTIARQHLSHPSMPPILDAHAQLLMSEAEDLRAQAQRARVAGANTVRAYTPQ